MATLRLSPMSLRRPATSPAASSAATASSSSLRFAASLTRVPSLKLFLRRRRLVRRGGGTPAAVSGDSAASSYASALADVASSNGTLEATLVDMEKLKGVFADQATLTFFTHPTLDPEKKLAIASDIAKSTELQPHVANFLNILVEMGRTDIIGDVADEFEECFNNLTNTEVAVVSSVVPLEPQDLAQIAQIVQKQTGAKNVRIKTELNPELIAGFTVRFGLSGSKFIDMSVKKQLDEITTQFDFSNLSFA